MSGKKSFSPWNKKLVIVKRASDFQALHDPGYCRMNFSAGLPQEIIIPKHHNIKKRPLQAADKIQANYIRFHKNCSFLNACTYTLDGADSLFVEEILQKKCLFKEQILQKMIESLEKRCNKDKNFADFLPLLCQIYAKQCNVRQFCKRRQQIEYCVREVWLYWRNKRKSFSSPLLRCFWPGPYRQRESNPIEIRYTNADREKVEETIILCVFQDLLQLKQVFGLIVKRQKHEQRIFSSQMSYFKANCQKVLNSMNKNEPISVSSVKDKIAIQQKSRAEKAEITLCELMNLQDSKIDEQSKVDEGIFRAQAKT